MSNFVKLVSVVAVIGSLAPFAAQARSGDLDPTGPATHVVQFHSKSAFAAGRSSENVHFADNASSFENRGTVSRNAYASNAVPVGFRWVRVG